MNNIPNKQEATLFSMTSVTSIVSIISALLISGGYLYNFLIFSYFDLKISNFFTTTDYIASSLDVIGTVLISSIVFYISFFAAYYLPKKFEKNNEQTVSLSLQEIQSIEIKNKIKQVWLTIILLVFLIIVIFLNNFSLNLLEGIILFSSILIFQTISIFKSINNHILKQAVILAFLYFIMEIYINATNEINRILDSKTQNVYNYKLLNKEDINSLIFIKSISQYSFFYDTIPDHIVVIPNSQIEKIEHNFSHKDFLGKVSKVTK
ncbi:hypothetical protein [Sulfurospirillum sp. hDNRA2]|uniref:hypothetical protein n=1 Tax=Sulfurospirillum sp. hDNRA2 TaxID=3237298 RepID=UPI0020B6DC1F|nr:hypothetical protein [Sulfurospirillum sp. DNRA8]MCP3652992.1 hypothetical protein [Sulfurospirillum sp. DNRA8]MCR1811843.1 hypothetical protein [Sulfurospirillum sp. DNRA8]